MTKNSNKKPARHAPIMALIGVLALYVLAFNAMAIRGALAIDLAAAPDKAWLARINQSLKAMPPLSGRFQQKLPNGAHAAGSYAIDWPNRLRFAYDVGGESIVTVKGKFVAVQETAGAEANWFPVALTPLAVLRQAINDGIRADMVRDFTLRDDNYSITLTDPSAELPGQAQLFFTRTGDRLYAWQLTDVQNLVTMVRLSEIITHDSLPRNSFDIIENEEDDY
ncbi:MAG: outer membrane lipoprotein carrier protein LolA [Alphaproteobacteria bacterium]|jgi:outer membrane lipoprotein-sorting protein|nr:outer membrane lipoprotein carrier protein LolA [Alphaproteobacteria bacterium]